MKDLGSETSMSSLRCNFRKELEVPPYVTKFSPFKSEKDLLLVASEDGEIFVHDKLDKNCHNPTYKLIAHDNAIYDIVWMSSSSFITVSGDKTAALWDLSTRTNLSNFCGHESSVKTVDVRPDDNAVFATGGRDGNIMLWDTRSVGRNRPNYVVNVLRRIHCNLGSIKTSKTREKVNNGVTAVLFQDNNTLISSGAGDGEIKFWDIRRSYSAYRNEPKPTKCIPYSGNSIKQNGYTSLSLDCSGRRLFASCTDNVIYEYNCTSCQLVSKYTGHRNSSYYVKIALCPQNQYLLSGSSDEYAYIWRLGGNGKPLYRLNGHTDEVTSVDWCKSDDTKIATCCDDMRYRLWSIRTNDSTNSHEEGNIENISSQDNDLNSAYICNLDTIIPSPRQTPLQEILLNNQISSPTANLPNLVLDQLATPENIARSTKKRTPLSSNWLLEMQDAKKLKQCSAQSTIPRTRKTRVKCKIDKCLENYFNFI